MNARYSIGCAIPTLNSVAVLERTLFSLKNQQSGRPEIIVADSGSTDGTLELCAEWRVPVIQIERGNMYRAINAALRQLRTDWLFYLNSDDTLYPDALARLLECGERTGADFVYGDCDRIDINDRFFYSVASAAPDDLLPLLRLGIFAFAQQGTIFRRSLFERLGGFAEEFRLSADAEFFQRALLGGARAAVVERPPVACFRIHDRQLTSTAAAAMEEEKKAIRARAGAMTFSDRLAYIRWKSKNLPHYAIRIMRSTMLSKPVIRHAI